MQRRLEAALALERFVMGGATRPSHGPRVAHASWWPRWRATCGRCCATCSAATSTPTSRAWPTTSCWRTPRSGEIEARDLRKEPRFEREPPPAGEPEPYLDFDYESDADYEPEPAPDYEAELDAEPDTAELEPVSVAPEPVQHELDGVTPSADWGWDDPEDFSAPV